MSTITVEALLAATEVNLYGLSGAKEISSEEWARAQKQTLEEGPADTLDKSGHVLSCAVSLFDAKDKSEKTKCSNVLCAALWFAHLRVRGQLMQQADMVKDLKDQVDALQAGNDDMSSALAAKNDQLDLSAGELVKVRECLDETKLDLVSQRDKNVEMADHVATLKKRVDTLKAGNDDMSSALAAKNNQLDVSTDELAKVREALKEADLDLVSQRNKNTEMADYVVTLKKQLTDWETVDALQVTRQAKLHSELKKLTESECEMEKQIESLSDARALSDRKVSTLSTELGECKQALSDLSEEREKLRNGIQSWRERCNALELKCQQTQDGILQYQTEYDKCKNIVEQKDQCIVALNGEVSEYKNCLQRVEAENRDLHLQVAQVPALQLQIQKLKQVPDVSGGRAPPSGETPYMEPRPWGQTRPGGTHFYEPTTASTTTTYSLWNSQMSTGINAGNALLAFGQKQNVPSSAVWAEELEGRVTGIAVGEPAPGNNALAPPVGGAAAQDNVTTFTGLSKRDGRSKSFPHPDLSEDEEVTPILTRKKNRNKNAPLMWNTSEDFSEIRQIQKMLTLFSKDSKASIHTHLNLYEKILRNFGIDSTMKMIRYLSWTFDKNEQNFFLSLDLNEFSTWSEYKKAVLRQFSPYRNEQEALKYALNISCFPNQHPRDFLHVLKNAFSQAYEEVDLDSLAFKNAFYHGLPLATKTQLALNYDGTQNLKWILAQAQRIFEVSKVPEVKENKLKSAGTKNVSEVNKASELSLEAGAKQGGAPKKKNSQENTKIVDSGDKSGSDSSNGSNQKYDFYVSKNYRGDRPIQNYQYRQNDRNRNNSGNSESNRNAQNRETTGARQNEQRNWQQQNEQRNWTQQRERSPPRGREQTQQPSRLEAIEHQVKYLADAMGGFLRAQAQLESKLEMRQTQQSAENTNE